MTARRKRLKAWSLHNHRKRLELRLVGAGRIDELVVGTAFLLVNRRQEVVQSWRIKPYSQPGDMPPLGDFKVRSTDFPSGRWLDAEGDVVVQIVG